MQTYDYMTTCTKSLGVDICSPFIKMISEQNVLKFYCSLKWSLNKKN